MSQAVVLVIFYSRCGSTETLASAAAVGAVQARALIRLRRVPDVSPQGTLEAFPDCRDTLLRMHKEYVPPTESDVLGADAIVLAPPAGVDTSSSEWADVLGVLSRLASDGKLAGKAGAVVDAGNASTLASFSAAMSRFGFVAPTGDSASATADAAERAKAVGRSLANLVRTLKPGTTATGH